MGRFRARAAACVLVCIALTASSASASTLGSPVTSLLGAVTASQLAQAEAKADEWWSQYSNLIYNMLHGGRGAGMCTDYVSARRPDVVERVEKLVVVSHVLTNQNGPVLVNWLAKEWAHNARWAGLRVGHKPRPRAVIVFQPGAYGASDRGGHVAIVDRVGRNGAFTISEEHAPDVGVVSRRHFSARSARAMTRDRRILFIY